MQWMIAHFLAAGKLLSCYCSNDSPSTGLPHYPMLNLIGPAENFQQFVSAAMVRFKAVFYFHVSGFAKFFILTSFLILDYYNKNEQNKATV